MNNFGTAQFLLFVIDASKYIFKAIIFIHVTFMHKTKVFLKAFVAGLVFFTYFYFQHFLRNNIADDIFLKINVYFYLTVPLSLGHDTVVHRNRWRNVEVFCHFSQYTWYHKIVKNTTTTTKRCVNELVRLRTMGHLIEKNYQVTDHYLCMVHVLGGPELHF